MYRSTSRIALLLLLASLLGCSSYRGARQAQIAEQQADWDAAVLHYLKLVDLYPNKLTYRAGLLRSKMKASQAHFERAKKFHSSGSLNRALTEYQLAVQLDPSNQYALVELEKLAQEIAQAREAGGPTPTLEQMKSTARGARVLPPVLDPRSREPISLGFPKPVSVFDIYRALGKAFGINVLFDPKLRDQEIAIELEEVVAQDALEILMRAANHFYKVLDEHTIIVAEDNAQNRRAYQDLVIQTFFLSNANVKDVMTMLRSLIGAKNIAANDQLNAIVLRDTADKVRVAERIITTNDKSRGELVVDVELLQINTNKLQELGVTLSQYQITQQLDPALQVEGTGGIRFSDLEFINQSNWLVTIPGFIYDFIKTSSEAQLLASPQVRISDGEKATVHIGERVPIPVTTFNTGQTVGGNIVPITSFQYQDIGIRLDIEPRIHHNKQITLKINVEFSQLTGFVEGGGGAQQPIIGTRTIESTIRLMDGETNFLAGLIRTDETETNTGVPGLSDIPLLGRLFGSKSTQSQRTDLILTLTPHIIRIPNITEEDLLPIWVGTESHITFRGGSPRVESEVEGPFDEGADQDAERIREMIRRRIQNLPRGLRESAGAGGQEREEPQPGVDLAPSAPPRDPFQEREEDGEPPGTVSDLSWLSGELEVLSLTAARAEVEEKKSPAETRVRIELRPSSEVVAVGETFEVLLVAVAAVPVSHLPITLRYNPEKLRVEDVIQGRFLGPESRSVVLADFSRPGRLVLGASRLGDVPGVVGTGTVARIRFTALVPGQATVGFRRAQVLDAALKRLRPVERTPARLSIVAAHTPEEEAEALGSRPREPEPPDS